MFTPTPYLVKDRSPASAPDLRARGDGLMGSDAPGSAAAILPDEVVRSVRSLLLEDGSRGRFVRDQTVEQPSLQCRADRRHLGAADCRADGQRLGGDMWRNAGETNIRAAIDNAAVLVEGPASQFADCAQAH